MTSTVVQLTPRPAPLHPADRAQLERVTAAAFGQRRKMLRQSLKAVAADPIALLARVGIEETRRAEELDVGQFCALARALGGFGVALGSTGFVILSVVRVMSSHSRVACDDTLPH